MNEHQKKFHDKHSKIVASGVSERGKLKFNTLQSTSAADLINIFNAKNKHHPHFLMEPVDVKNFQGKKSAIIFQTDVPEHDNIAHWTSILYDKGKYIYFDSLGYNYKDCYPSSLLKLPITEPLSLTQFQDGSTQTCGEWASIYLSSNPHCIKTTYAGMHKGSKDLFSHNARLLNNDKKIVQYSNKIVQK